MNSRDDYCPIEATRQRLDWHASMLAFYEPLAHAHGHDSIAERQMHRHRGMVEYLHLTLKEARDHE